MLRELLRELLPPTAPAPYAPQAPVLPRRSGPWRLYVPRQTTSSGASEPGSPVEGAALGFGDTPTMMQEWWLEHVQLPACLLATTSAEVKETLTCVVQATLLLGGDPVWSQPLEIAMLPNNAGKTSFLTNFTIAEDFAHEVCVKHGQQLVLVCSFAFNQATASSKLLLSGSEGLTSHQGVIQYHALALSGHRVLG